MGGLQIGFLTSPKDGIDLAGPEPSVAFFRSLRSDHHQRHGGHRPGGDPDCSVSAIRRHS